MTNIPDGLPTLAAGPHNKDSGKACVMEYVSVISGSDWTDFPPCTNRIIARVAQSINDTAPDDIRHLLVPYIDRLASATGSNEEFYNWAKSLISEGHQAQVNLELGVNGVPVYDADPEMAERIVGNWLGDEVTDRMVKIYERAEPRERIKRGLAMLDEILAKHQEMFYITVTPVPQEALARARELIETRALVV